MKRWSLATWVLAGWAALMILCAFVFFVVYAPFTTEHLVSNMSMSPAVELNDSFLVSRFSYLRSEPQRGDVVVYRVDGRGIPGNYASRIIGLPGDKIEMRASRIYIDDVLVPIRPVASEGGMDPGNAIIYKNRYIETLPNGYSYEIYDVRLDAPYDDTIAYKVPAGHYFVIGDNRDNSDDSRSMADIGYVPLASIVGKAAYVYDAIYRPRVGRRIR